MQLVCERRSNDEIGRRLNLSDGTVKMHVHSIYRKLSIRNRMTLKAMAAELSPNVGKGRDQAANERLALEPT